MRAYGDDPEKRFYYEDLSYTDILNVVCIGHRFNTS